MSYYLEAKKSLGQNFLKNRTIVNRIAEAGEISAGEIIIEIGPGTGELTAGLLDQIKKSSISNASSSAKLIAIEKDQRAIPILQQRFVNEIQAGILEVVEGDFLEIDIEEFLKKYTTTENTAEKKVSVKTKDSAKSKKSSNYSYKIIANIPYYITGAIIRKSLESKIKPARLIFLVQKEVAERIICRDGKESILSQSVRAYGDAKLLMVVSKGNFVPVPRVDSAVLLIGNISQARFEKAGIKEKALFDVLHAGFGHKRKKLSSNLSELFGSAEKTKKIFEKMNIDPNIRAENLSIDQWIALTAAL